MIAGAVVAGGGAALGAEALGAGDARRAKPTFTPPKIAAARSATKSTPYTTARFELAWGAGGATGIGAGAGWDTKAEGGSGGGVARDGRAASGDDGSSSGICRSRRSIWIVALGFGSSFFMPAPKSVPRRPEALAREERYRPRMRRILVFLAAAACSKPSPPPQEAPPAPSAPAPTPTDAAAPVLEGNAAAGMPSQADLWPLAKRGEACQWCAFNVRCALLTDGRADANLGCCDYSSGAKQGEWDPASNASQCLALVLGAPYAPDKAKANLMPLARSGECARCTFDARCVLATRDRTKACCDYEGGTTAGAWKATDANAAKCLARVAATPPSTRYPIGAQCSDPDAIAREKRSLPPRVSWDKLGSSSAKIEVRVPPDVFVPSEGADGWKLTSSLKARGLGPDPTTHVFAIRFQRFAKSIDALLADKTIAKAFPDLAFPKQTEASFTPSGDADVVPGFAGRAVVAGHPAFVWVSGVEGYNTDHALVKLGPSDTLFVAADWNSAIMMGQPECYQRTVISGVVDSLKVL
jgi:hypothetical protein